MRKYEIRIEPAKERKYQIGIFCDLCGRQILTSHPKIEISETYNYGSDGGNSEEYDCCEKCWKTEIVPLFELREAKPTESDW